MTAARLRERFGVPGMSVDAVRGFRDKQLMKERVAAAGLRVPRAIRVRTTSEVRAAAERIGYPLVLKPIAGAGSADTYKVEDATRARAGDRADAATCARRAARSTSTATSSRSTPCACNGKPAFENIAHYLPKPLEARSNEWISPVIITVRDMAAAARSRAGIAARRAACSTRSAWATASRTWSGSARASGEAVFGEIGCRPGGAHLVDQMNYTCDIDLFREWARAVCWHDFRGADRAQVQRGDRLQAREGARPHHAPRRRPRVPAPLR